MEHFLERLMSCGDKVTLREKNRGKKVLKNNRLLDWNCATKLTHLHGTSCMGCQIGYLVEQTSYSTYTDEYYRFYQCFVSKAALSHCLCRNNQPATTSDILKMEMRLQVVEL